MPSEIDIEDGDCWVPPEQPTGAPVMGIPEEKLVSIQRAPWASRTSIMIALTGYITLWCGVLLSVTEVKEDIGTTLIMLGAHLFVLGSACLAVNYHHEAVYTPLAYLTATITLGASISSAVLLSDRWDICLIVGADCMAWIGFVILRRTAAVAQLPPAYQPVTEPRYCMCKSGIISVTFGYVLCWAALFASLAGQPSAATGVGMLGVALGGTGAACLLFIRTPLNKHVNWAALSLGILGTVLITMFCSLYYFADVSSADDLTPWALSVEVGTGLPMTVVLLLVNRTGKVYKASSFPAGLVVSVLGVVAGYSLLWAALFSLVKDGLPGDVLFVTGLSSSIAGWGSLSVIITLYDRLVVSVLQVTLGGILLCCTPLYIYLTLLNNVDNFVGLMFLYACFTCGVAFAVFGTRVLTKREADDTGGANDENLLLSNTVPQVGVVIVPAVSSRSAEEEEFGSSMPEVYQQQRDGVEAPLMRSYFTTYS